MLSFQNVVGVPRKGSSSSRNDPEEIKMVTASSKSSESKVADEKLRSNDGTESKKYCSRRKGSCRLESFQNRFHCITSTFSMHRHQKSEIQPRLPCLSSLATYDDDKYQQQPPSMTPNNSSLPPMLPRKEQKFLEAAVTSLAKQIVLERRRQFSTSASSGSGPDPDPSAPTPPIGDPEIKPEKKKIRRKPKRMIVPNYGPDADNAIQSLQAARKDKAHAKTSANIRRALYGNVIICVAKLGAWISSGSSSMMSEFVHSVVDCGNQSLLLMGLRGSRNAADKLHPGLWFRNWEPSSWELE